ncbi:MAG: hypothetical protein CBC48_13445 [bacterium TMED88]|nr:hypothetical protein [Deltaproteobacteria bacterium]OUV28375.1 MAG: hypothetical protein CBC48_13445 [bacterium TMED88]
MKYSEPDLAGRPMRAPASQGADPKRVRRRRTRLGGPSLPFRVRLWELHAWALMLTLMAAAVASASLGPPHEINAQALHGFRVDLSWNEAPGDPDGYRVARQCSTGDSEGYCTIAVLSAAARRYSDEDVQPGQALHYRVEAYRGPERQSATISMTTPPPTTLPVDLDPPPEQPLYPEPQGAWSLGPALSLTDLQTIHLSHNLATASELRILLAPAEPHDPANPCRQHSLIGRLGVAGYTASLEPEYTGHPAAQTAEIYFHDFSRPVAGSGSLPPAIESFDQIGDEGYVLLAESVDAEGAPPRLRIVVGAHSPKGLFRGGMTVQRLLVDDTLCSARSELQPVVVLDYPDHGYRAAMIKTKMNANYNSVPGQDLDRLDTVARSGATAVNWGNTYAAQESWTWDNKGSKSAAAFKIAAAERFMEVKHTLGNSAILFGTREGETPEQSVLSLSQVPYGDGLAVLEEPFSWLETPAGDWHAQPERLGTLHTLDSRMTTPPPQSPWVPGTCSSTNWVHDTLEGRSGSQNNSFRLDGPANNCHLVQTLDITDAFASERYFLSAWVKASAAAANLSASLVLEVTTASGATVFSLPLPPSLPGEGWIQLTLPIESIAPGEAVNQAQLSVRASMDDGALWVDGFTLYEWDRAVFPFGRFPDSNGWNFSNGSGTFQIDTEQGRLDSTSLKMPYPMQMNGLSAHLATRYHPINFEPGRYVLSGWIKAERTVLEERPIEEDQDQDGLPDDFEIFLGLDPTDPDMDGDDYNDGIEFVANSSPTDPGSIPQPWFPIHSDISLKLYNEDLTDGNPTTPLRAEYLTLPNSIYLDEGDWYYYSHIFDISEADAETIKTGRFQVRAWQTTAAGTYWIDDLQVRRLSGDLRNLLGAFQQPIINKPSGETYAEGSDYEVCQVGETDTECAQPLNYSRTLKGGLASTYQEDQPPFEIRWLGSSAPTEKRMAISYDIGTQYTKVSTSARGWDGTPITRGELNFCDVDKLVDGIKLDQVFDRLMNNYTLPAFPPNGGEDYVLNADLVSYSVSEVRGMNRSLACLDEQGVPTLSNAGRFANLVNRAFSMIQSRAEMIPGSDLRYVMWDDMFNPFDNGGDPNYQVKYGGFTGRTACSYAPYQLEEICAEEIAEVEAGKFTPIVEGSDLIMEPWNYYPSSIRRMVAISSFYEELGVTSHVLPADHPVNIDDWAGIANQFDDIDGVHATYFRVTSGSNEFAGTRLGVQAFWNHDWKLLYMHDNETPDSSFYQIPWPFEATLTLENATPDTSGTCAVGADKFDGNNDGGLCLLGSTGTPQIGLNGIPVHGGRSYRIGVFAQRHSDYQSAELTSEVPLPSIEVIWSDGSSTGPITSTRVYDSTDKKYSDGFDRYRIEAEAPAEATAMNVVFNFGASGKLLAADDIVIFESNPPCFSQCSLDPYLQDSDGDGLSNGWELFYGFNPNVPGEDALDPDLDGLTNLWEQNANGDPFLADTDGDGFSDGEEAAAGTLLDDPNSFPVAVSTLAMATRLVLATLLGLTAASRLKKRSTAPRTA